MERFRKTIYLLVVGGDGTINEVLNGITDFDRVRLGVIPTGSGNDFARNLGILRDTREDLQEITASIDQEQNQETPTDRSWESKLGRVRAKNLRYQCRCRSGINIYKGVRQS